MSEEKIKDLKEQLKNEKILQLRLLYFLALSGSLTGAILMIAFPMYGSYWGYGVYVYVGAGFALITVGIILLLVCSFISIYGLIYPDRMEKKFVLIGIFIPLLILALSFGGLAYAYSAFSEAWSWWTDAGFYGSVIPGPLTAVFFILIYLSMRKS